MRLTTLSGLMALTGILGQEAPATCNNMWPAWSPDGTRIVFSSDRTGDPEVYIQTLGGEAVRLTTSPGRDAHPSFSPDGRTIAFQSPREGPHTNLYVMNADGSGQRRITSHEGFAGVPVWSPDGTHIAYQWTPDLKSAKWRLMLLRIGSGEPPRQLTDGTAHDQVINWAPDGRRFVFHSDRTGRNQLYTLTLDGQVHRLMSTPYDDRNGAWSPDGRTIAFVSDRDAKPAAVFLMNADGTGATRVGGLTLEHGLQTFSPDGTRLLGTRVGPRGQEIVAIRIADGAIETLAACPTVRTSSR